jgi:chemotaxis protein CheZ
MNQASRHTDPCDQALPTAPMPLAARLQQLRATRGDLSAHELKIYNELEALAHYIERAKHEVSTVRCEDIPTKHIPTASLELDAIGSHLEEATGVILDACERLDRVAGRVGGEVSAAISDEVTRIYEACSFQDIAGQRMTKIVTALHTIEDRIGRLLVALGHDLEVAPPRAATEAPTVPATARRGDDGLLDGPQAPGAGNSQADIDALFATFG